VSILTLRSALRYRRLRQPAVEVSGILPMETL